MKIRLTYILLFFVFSSKAQFNEQKGAVAEGFDVVSYFQGKPKKGTSALKVTYADAEFRFSSEENLKAFKNNPKKYIPQYGGYCAYAMADGKKVKVNPNTFEIREDKLYLFYNSWGNNTLELWEEEGAEALRKNADANWQKITAKHR
ncbi:YHS domain-containing (seleno)protein [Galbibacter mesophilus]|uniref:YHS domain-containing (seleno)protein n=1 Tax=Galbibacter mesophilus TaxID=379069 RepID=UPI00191D332D|nr:YHS domain-containing (seleno)protein [Galbibacter mesophilus]MCM5661903.1 YHS domain-containing protein [Galbibacter mesophilus]